MADSKQETAAEKLARAAREKELARRAAAKKGQEKANATVHRPLVQAG